MDMDTTNEPVAWIPKDHLKEMGKAGFRYTAVSYQEDKFYDIPLYTHPVKELTDGEIEECYWGDGYPNNPRHPKEFARAILRKAQEK